MNDELIESYRMALDEYNNILAFFDSCEPDQTDEAIFRLLACMERIKRTKRELTLSLGGMTA